MSVVYVLQHEYETDSGGGHVKFIGAYSTRERAEAAVERLRDQPGFSSYLEGFCIDEYELDRDHWTEGFVTID